MEGCIKWPLEIGVPARRCTPMIHRWLCVTDAFPNPSEGTVTFSWSGNDSTADIYIVDVTGKTIASFLNVTRNEQHNLDVSPGHFIVQIITNSTSGASRLQIAN